MGGSSRAPLNIFERYSDLLEAHITQAARFGILLNRLIESDVEFHRLVMENSPIDENMIGRGEIVEQFGETIEALRETLTSEQEVISELGNYLKSLGLG